jgi:hypothetical protein
MNARVHRKPNECHPARRDKDRSHCPEALLVAEPLAELMLGQRRKGIAGSDARAPVAP